MSDRAHTNARPSHRSRGSISNWVIAVLVYAMVSWVCYHETSVAWERTKWTPMPCKIVASSVKELPRPDLSKGEVRQLQPYRLVMRFEYVVNGKTYVGEKPHVHTVKSNDAAKIFAHVRQFPEGSTATCYVNPNDPTKAILWRDAMWPYWIWVGVMVLLGVGMVLTWRLLRLPAKRPGKSPVVNVAQFERFATSGALLALAAILLWGAFGYLFPAGATRAWAKTPCTIIGRSVMGTDRGLARFYHSDILYRYRVGEVEYFSNQYALTDFATIWWFSGKRRLAMQYEDGAATVCYVNPKDPSQAVLKRGLTAPMLWFAIPAALVLAIVFGRSPHARPRFDPDPQAGERAGFTFGFALSALLVLVIAGDFSADLRGGIWTLGEVATFGGLLLFMFAMAAGVLRRRAA